MPRVVAPHPTSQIINRVQVASHPQRQTKGGVAVAHGIHAFTDLPRERLGDEWILRREVFAELVGFSVRVRGGERRRGSDAGERDEFGDAAAAEAGERTRREPGTPRHAHAQGVHDAVPRDGRVRGGELAVSVDVEDGSDFVFHLVPVHLDVPSLLEHLRGDEAGAGEDEADVGARAHGLARGVPRDGAEAEVRAERPRVLQHLLRRRYQPAPARHRADILLLIRTRSPPTDWLASRVTSTREGPTRRGSIHTHVRP